MWAAITAHSVFPTILSGFADCGFSQLLYILDIYYGSGGIMKKRVVALLAALVFFASIVTAAPLLQLGPLVSYNKTVVEFDDGEEWGDINNFSFGADIRINPLKHMSIDIPATIGFGNGGAFSIAAIPTINANFPIGGIADIAIGAGTQFDFQYTGKDGDWTMNGLSLDDAGDAFSNSKLVYRLGVTFNLAFLSIGANAILPGSAGFGEGDIGGIFNPMWESTRVSVVALFNLF